MSLILPAQPLYLQRQPSTTGHAIELRTYARAEVRQTTLHNARLYGPGIAYAAEGPHFAGMTYSNRSDYIDTVLKHCPLPDNGTLDAEGTLLWGYHTYMPDIPCNWGHFIWTYLLRLTFTASCPLVVSKKVPERFLDWARALGFSEFIKVDDGVAVRTLHVPSVLCYRQNDEHGTIAVLPSAVYALRQRLGVGLPHQPRTKVYVARGKGSWRRVGNEGELVDALVACGFAVIYPDVMTVSQQLEAMASAEIVVIPIGGSSAITMFAPEDCRVIELAFPGIVGSFAASLWADVLGQRYERIDGCAGEQTGPLAIDRDYVVPVTEVLMRL